MPLPIMAAWGIWSAIPKPIKIAGAAAIALFITYQVGHWRGDNYRNAIWQTKIRAEIAAQEKVIDAAKDEAIKEVVRLNAEVEKRDAEIVKLQEEADKDVNAKRPALGVDSLRRINRGRSH